MKVNHNSSSSVINIGNGLAAVEVARADCTKCPINDLFKSLPGDYQQYIMCEYEGLGFCPQGGAIMCQLGGEGLAKVNGEAYKAILTKRAS